MAKMNTNEVYKAKPKSQEGWRETIKTVIYAVLIALVIRTVAYEPFNIPSGSMLPTLLIGDYVFVAKYPYGFSKHSMPLSPPLFSGRINESPVKRGDIAVFKLPSDNSTDYIKRVIGLPGDRIQVTDGLLHINGKAVKRERVDDFMQQHFGARYGRVRQYQETLPNGRLTSRLMTTSRLLPLSALSWVPPLGDLRTTRRSLRSTSRWTALL